MFANQFEWAGVAHFHQVQWQRQSHKFVLDTLSRIHTQKGLNTSNKNFIAGNFGKEAALSWFWQKKI